MTGEVHIYRATGLRYQARIRSAEQRKWTRIGRPSRSEKPAIMAAAQAMTVARPGDRAYVIHWADMYAPNVLVKMVRR